MSQAEVYQQIHDFLVHDLAGSLNQRTVKRLVLLVAGVLKGQSSAPSQMAEAIHELGIGAANVESIERRIRRSENDATITARRCYAPVIGGLLRRSKMKEVILILDPTTQADHVVMVSVSAWYRGRALPLAWTIWPGNVPLEGAQFWERILDVFIEVQQILPSDVSVTILADRAFGCPAFIDLVSLCGWHWLVRVQDQTVCRDRRGRERAVRQLVQRRGERRKLAGKIFKKAGWRSASVVVYWGQRHSKPLCLASDLPPHWELIGLYRRRFPIEATFRDYKSYGWRWEQGQVRILAHVERLLVAMALATCLTLLLGAQFAADLLARPASGKRRTRPRLAKFSLFRLGLLQWRKCFAAASPFSLPDAFPDWQARNWSAQFLAHIVHAFIFA